MKYVILLIGSGGREHAISKALFRTKEDEDTIELYCFASNYNPGIRKLAKQVIVGKSKEELDSLLEIITNTYKNESKIFNTDDYTIYAIIGPEAPIAEGYAEYLMSKGIECVAPYSDYAQIETSKIFTRELLDNHEMFIYNPFYIINPCYEDNVLDHATLLVELEEFNGEYVIKDNGLAGGKGVKLSGEHLNNTDEAITFIDSIISKGNSFIVEEKLIGKEFSVFSFTDGHNVIHCPAVQDYKRAFENDNGPNTGGMGSINNLDFLTEHDYQEACKVNEKIVQNMKSELGGNRGYKGILYGSFIKINSSNSIKVIEYNCRFGDPECLNILELLESNLAELFASIVYNTLGTYKIRFSDKHTVCKYLVPEGYPNNPLKNFDIYFDKNCPLDVRENFIYASIEENGEHLYELGSRTLAYVGVGNTREDAYNDVTRALRYVQGRLFYRDDIGKTTRSKYEMAGVNIEEGNEVVRKIGMLQNVETQNPVYNDLKKIREDDHNSFNGIVNVGQIIKYYHKNVNDKFDVVSSHVSRTNDNRPAIVNTIYNYKLVVSSDGVGTKSILSKRWFGANGVRMLGHDLVNHCVDDILVSGSHPIMFQDYFASSKIDSNEVSAFVDGVLEACKNNNCLLTGGETAEMPDIYQPDMIDVVGTIVGFRDDLYAFHPKENIKENDIILALPSVSPHTNGFSLIRKIAEKVGEENMSQELKLKLVTPHKSYLKEISEIQKNRELFKQLHGICHITGGGFVDNPPRVLSHDLKVDLNNELIFSNLPDYFQWIMENGELTEGEMLQVFNCGIGMLLFVEPNTVDIFLEILENAYVIGDVISQTI